MRIAILILTLVFIFSCDDEEKIDNTNLPPVTDSECVFNKFDTKYKYEETRDSEKNIEDIFKITRYKDEYNDLKILKINITSQNSRDSLNKIKLVDLKIACNYTQIEFDIENCTMINEREFSRTEVYCNGLDDYLYDRVSESELVSYSNDTLVLYERRNDWYHYFVKDNENEVVENPELPSVKFSSNNIYVRNDTMHIPLNINYLRNDSTKCYIMDQEVTPEFLNMNTSYIVFPEFELKDKEDYNLRRIVDFKAISNNNSFCHIDSIIFFRNLWFNNIEVFVENVYFEIHHTRSSYHPQYGSSYSKDSSFRYNSYWKTKYNLSSPKFNPAVYYYFPHSIDFKDNILKGISIIIPHYVVDWFEGSSILKLHNLDINLVPNKLNYDLLISNKKYLTENLNHSYSEEYTNSGSSTRTTETKYIKNFQTTDSSYVKIKIWRD